MRSNQMSSPTRNHRDPYDFALMSPLNNNDIEVLTHDEYDEATWEESFTKKSLPRHVSKNLFDNLSQGSHFERGRPASAIARISKEKKIVISNRPLSHTISSAPSISTLFLKERKKREEAEKRLFDSQIQEEGESMHLQLQRNIEEINELSVSLGTCTMYSVRNEDKYLVRSGKEYGQAFILKRVLSNISKRVMNSVIHNSNSSNRNKNRDNVNKSINNNIFSNPKNSSDDRNENKERWSECNPTTDRMLTMSVFLKEFQNLKVEACKRRSIKPSSHMIASDTNNIKNNNNTNDSERNNDRKGTGNPKDGQQLHDPYKNSIPNPNPNSYSITPYDPVERAYKSGGRLLATLLNRKQSETNVDVDYPQDYHQTRQATIQEKDKSQYFRATTRDSNELDSESKNYSVIKNSAQPAHANGASRQSILTGKEIQKEIEFQQRRVLEGTVALTREVEAQIAEVRRRGWNR